MPFKLRWPFRWPRRKTVPQAEDEALTATTKAATEGAQPEAAPGTAERHEPLPDAKPTRVESLGAVSGPFVSGSDEPDLADAGLKRELLDRLAGLTTPPTLGPLGGLPAMAQTLPTVERFMRQLPAAPVQRLLESTLTAPGEFAESLSALSSFGGPAAPPGGAAFSEQLAPSVSLTDVLPPLGSVPGQIPALSGQAPVLTPARETAPPSPLAAAAPALPQPEAIPPQRPAVQPPEPTRGEAGQRQAGAPAPPVMAAWLPAEPPGPLTRVLPPALTLTANILLESEFAPVQRALAPYTPAWGAPDEFAAPGAPEAERLTPAQRSSIETQRAQGRPLQPEVREHFETAYGASLGEVRVHTGQSAHSAAQSLNAIAFASGRDVFFTQNTFRPDTSQGLGLIGHELAHVVQQQYGLPGDSEALRPADDVFERRADQLAATALERPPLTAQAMSGAPVQRAIVGEFKLPLEAPPAVLDRAAAFDAGQRPLSTGTVGAETPEPVQRFGLGDLGSLARNVPAELPSVPTSLPQSLPSLGEAAERVSGLTDELPNPAEMLSSLRDRPELGGLGSLGSLGGLGSLRRLTDMGSLRGLSENLPGLGSLGERLGGAAGGLAGQLTGALPSLGELPSALGGLAGNLPAGEPGLPQLPGGLPSPGSAAQSLASDLPGLPQPPGIGARPGLGELPALSGLQLPEMPLTEGLGGLGSALGGAIPGGQEALGSITSLAPSAPEMPAAPPLPNLEKLTEHIWKQVQHKLKIERERSRGLA